MNFVLPIAYIIQRDKLGVKGGLTRCRRSWNPIASKAIPAARKRAILPILQLAAKNLLVNSKSRNPIRCLMIEKRQVVLTYAIHTASSSLIEKLPLFYDPKLIIDACVARRNTSKRE